MKDKESRDLSQSQMLSQISIGLIFALAAFLAFALDKRELGNLYWVLVILGVAILVASMILGGRGIASISSPNGLFNYQAWTLVFGFLFLACSFFALGSPLSNETSTQIVGISEKLGVLKSRLDNLETPIRSNTSISKQNSLMVDNLVEDLNHMTKQVDRLEKNINFNNKVDSGFQGKAQQIAPADN